MKLCVDCRHVILPTKLEPWHKCSREQSRTQSPVTGKWSDESAEAMRSADGACGVEGKLWEAAQECELG